jgi:hypothetical protein
MYWAWGTKPADPARTWVLVAIRDSIEHQGRGVEAPPKSSGVAGDNILHSHEESKRGKGCPKVNRRLQEENQEIVKSEGGIKRWQMIDLSGFRQWPDRW